MTRAGPSTSVCGLPRGDRLEARLATVTIAPGAIDKWHRQPNHPVVYVVEGTLAVEFRNGGSKIYKAGEGFVEPTNTVLRGVNSGQVPVKLVVFQLSAPGEPDSIDAPSQ
jgi:quercetin dioxygenase-like cupin family protein